MKEFWAKYGFHKTTYPARPKLEEAVVAVAAYFGGMSIPEACALGAKFADEMLNSLRDQDADMVVYLEWLEDNR